MSLTKGATVWLAAAGMAAMNVDLKGGPRDV
jgi:hypothetical protein